MLVFTAYALSGSFTPPRDLLLTQVTVQQVYDGSGAGPTAHILSFEPDGVLEETAFQLVSVFAERELSAQRNMFQLRVPVLKGNILYWVSGGTGLIYGVTQLIFEEFSAENAS